MVPQSTDEVARGPALICYDGSEPARAAIEHAAAVLREGEAIVLTVWESVGSVLLRGAFPGFGEMGREVREISEEVVAELDEGAAERALATATEGAQVAEAAGLDARPMARRAIAGLGERDDVTVWHAILAVSEEEDANVIVLGSRGRSGLKSMLLGSVSYGVLHSSPRPLLVVPRRADR